MGSEIEMEYERIKYTIGSSLFVIGIFVSIMIALELTILQIPFSIGTFRVHMIGFPWLTEQVANSTGLWRMPNYTQQFPNVYFLNYGEAFLISLVFVIYGNVLRNSSNVQQKDSRSTLSTVGLLGTIFSIVGLLYYWVRMTVLFNTYVFGNTVYYPASTPAPTKQWLEQFGLPLNINIQPYTGALVYHINTSTVPVGVGFEIDAGLYIVALLFLGSLFLWKYFESINKNINDEVNYI